MLNNKQLSEIKTDKIFRFRSPTNYNFESLLEDKIFASTPNALNDPIDCGITYNLDSLYKRLIAKKRFLEYFAFELFKPEKTNKYDNFDNTDDYLEYEQSLTEKCFSEMTNLKNRHIVKSAINKLAKQIIFELRDCFGVVSFSLVSGNSVMWSHYSTNFTGFVLGYDLKSFNSDVNNLVGSFYLTRGHPEFYGLHLIKYKNLNELTDGTDLMYELISKRITKKSDIEMSTMLDYVLNSKHSDVFLSFLTTKDKSWEYEHEIRLILPREDYYFEIFKTIGYNQSSYFEVAKKYAPSEIIIGMNMTKTNKAVVGYYAFQHPNVLLREIKDDKIMSERSLYKKQIKPSKLII